jgi:hypothetical protein
MDLAACLPNSLDVLSKDSKIQLSDTRSFRLSSFDAAARSAVIQDKQFRETPIMRLHLLTALPLVLAASFVQAQSLPEAMQQALRCPSGNPGRR